MSVALAAGPDVPVDPVTTLPNGDLQIPHRVSRAGWWSPGAAPADPAGTAVLVGHVDSRSQGMGAFHRLWSMRVGDPVEVVDTGRRHLRYRVVSVREYVKDEVPFADLFVTDGPRRLALVTCAGPFDPVTNYRDNLVVLAAPAQ